MEQVFTAAPHHDVLALLVQLAALLITARILGELAQRLGQPTVVGEILAGVLLGPSFLSRLMPVVGEWIVPQTATQGHLLEIFSLFGGMFLLLITGLETDVPLIRHHARPAFGVALGGLVLPLALGFTLGQLLPPDLLPVPEQRLVFALFMAIAMAISAIPVVAKVLIDLDLMRRDIGQTIIAAAMIDDTTGWVLLSIVIGLASTGLVTLSGVGQSVFTVLAFILLSFTLGRWLVSRLLDTVQNRLQMRNKVISTVLLLMLIWGGISQSLGIEALLGAFVIGVILSQMPRLNPDVIHTLEIFVLGFFAPIFFAIAGLKIDVVRLLEPRLLAISLVVIVIAVIGKIVGVYIGSRLIGKSDHWSAVFFGAGLNARGSIGIIVANIGLSLNIITQDMFSIIVVMAIATSLISLALMRWSVVYIKPRKEEIERIQKEQINRDSLMANIRRILLPVRPRDPGSTSQVIGAPILKEIMTESEMSLTLFSVATETNRVQASRYLDSLARMFSPQAMTRKVVTGENVGRLILDEAKNDYDLMILGAAEGQTSSDVFFTPLVDSLIRSASCPTMLIQGQHIHENWRPQRILVPSNGSLASRRAAEVAFAMATRGDKQVMILQVVEEQSSPHHIDALGVLAERQKATALASIERLRELGAMQGVYVWIDVQVATEPETVILNTAQHEQIDLIILGTHVSTGSDRLYLGRQVERILSSAPCPVIVLNT